MLLILAFVCLAGAIALVGQLVATPKRERQASLRRARADTESDGRIAAEERAMKAPVKMVGPTGLFIFPAMLIVIIAPAMIAPSSPAWNQCSVFGWMVCCSPGWRTVSCQTVKASRSVAASRAAGVRVGSPSV